MPNDRREFVKLTGATAAIVGAALAASPPAAGQTAGQFKGVKALAFDAYGTLFDVFSVTALCEQLFPGKGNQVAQIWRAKQLQYSLLRSLMGRHRDFWGLTEDGAPTGILMRNARRMLAILAIAGFVYDTR
jgi:2-haloacid dehalogenase